MPERTSLPVLSLEERQDFLKELEAELDPMKTTAQCGFTRRHLSEQALPTRSEAIQFHTLFDASVDVTSALRGSQNRELALSQNHSRGCDRASRSNDAFASRVKRDSCDPLANVFSTARDSGEAIRSRTSMARRVRKSSGVHLSLSEILISNVTQAALRANALNSQAFSVEPVRGKCYPIRL